MKQALLSVHDKTGLVEFARELNQLNWTLLATGSTAKLLMENKIPVTEISSYTGQPEILNGRVKTLHPAIHGGILARDNADDLQTLQQYHWNYIDLVVVNLYPFEQVTAKKDCTLEEAIENIDIGGVTLIRAAAKNNERVTVVCDPTDYSMIINELQQGEIKSTTRKQLAIKGFAITSHYDSAITHYLSPEKPVQLNLYPIQTLRYGENPHQQATLYGYTPNAGPLGGKLLQGKTLSYNNLLDLDAAWKTVCSFSTPTIAIVKHLSPCGVASSEKIKDAFIAALASDPISAFGGIIASNKEIDIETADAFGNLFIECIIAPQFSDEALNLLSKRTNCRLVVMPNLSIEPPEEWRSINQGMLLQSVDIDETTEMDWQIVSERQPTADEWTALQFAWRACQHVKSNAIVFAQGTATVGIGGGQPNRIDCVHIAAKHAGEKAKGAAMASDAFFPFKDAVEEAAKVGISAIIQPGGSIRDEEVISAANKANIAMVVTGIRHFRH